MASDLSFAEYVRDQMRGAGHVTFKKMFGEYAMYLDEKVVALVCDNQLFIRPTEDGRDFLGRVTEGAPYPGAKPHFLIAEELEDQELVAELTRRTALALPAPKPKKRKPKPAATGTAPTTRPAKSVTAKARQKRPPTASVRPSAKATGPRRPKRAAKRKS